MSGAVAGVCGPVKDELARLSVGRWCCRRAETAVMLRLSGALPRGDGGVLAVELDHGGAAQRLCAGIVEVYRHHAAAVARPARPGSYRHRWAVQVPDGHDLARLVGLLGPGAGLACGLGQRLVSGPVCDAVAAWRGALLATGALSGPGQPPDLHIAHPAHAITLAVALVAAAGRLGVPAATRTVRGVEQVAVTDPVAITALLTRLGAPHTAAAWAERRRSGPPAQVPGFTEANTARAARAAQAGVARTAHALEILGAEIAAGTVAAHLSAAGRLRLAHPQASLTDLAALADPPLSKATLAGQLRRLHARAEDHSRS